MNSAEREMIKEQFEDVMGQLPSPPDFSKDEQGHYTEGLTRLMYISFTEGIRVGTFLHAIGQ